MYVCVSVATYTSQVAQSEGEPPGLKLLVRWVGLTPLRPQTPGAAGGG